MSTDTLKVLQKLMAFGNPRGGYMLIYTQKMTMQAILMKLICQVACILVLGT